MDKSPQEFSWAWRFVHNSKINVSMTWKIRVMKLWHRKLKNNKPSTATVIIPINICNLNSDLFIFILFYLLLRFANTLTPSGSFQLLLFFYFSPNKAMKCNNRTVIGKRQHFVVLRRKMTRDNSVIDQQGYQIRIQYSNFWLRISIVKLLSRRLISNERSPVRSETGRRETLTLYKTKHSDTVMTNTISSCRTQEQKTEYSGSLYKNIVFVYSMSSWKTRTPDLKIDYHL